MKPRAKNEPRDYDLHELIEPLLEWFRVNRRDLPWRRTRLPYHVWLSEIMLQQTRVETALPYFERFLKRYPRLQDLARSEEAEVLSLWSGLGYYNRARNLRKAAQIVCERFDARFPTDLRQALELPGVGRYTAGAVLSIAYGLPVPILDGNIRRLMTRLLALETAPPELDKKLWGIMQDLVRTPRASKAISEFNQALMELGALVCLPRNPRCPQCPLQAHCVALAQERQQELPRKRSGRSSEQFIFTVAVVERDGLCLLRQTREESFLRGFWEFPRVPGPPAPSSEKEFLRIHGLHLHLGDSFSPVRHQITYRKLLFHPLVADLSSKVSGRDWRWGKLGEGELPVSSYTRKVWQRVQKASGQRSFRYNLPNEAG